MIVLSMLVPRAAHAEAVLGMQVDSTPLRTLTHQGGGHIFSLPADLFGLPRSVEPLPLLVIAPEWEMAIDGFSNAFEALLIQRNLPGVRASYGSRLRLTLSSHAGVARVGENVPFATHYQQLFCYDLETALQFVLGKRADLGLYASLAELVGPVASRARALGLTDQHDFAWTTIGIRVDGLL